MKPKPWLFLVPALALVALSAIIPLMTVVNYSLHFLVPGSTPEYVGLENYREVLRDPAFMAAIRRQFLFTTEILLIEIPLGLLVALAMPRQGWKLTGCLVLLGVPLLIPWNVVGMVWRVFTRADLGVVPAVLRWFHYDYRPAEHMVDAWWTVIAMDVWHWVPLVALLCFAGLQTIPAPYYQAAKIDGASGWATFRYVTLPRLRYVLIIAVLLRAMDSFNIYSEPYVLTGGFINFMSIYVSTQALSAFNLSTGAAMSVVYLYVVLIMCHVLYTIMLNVGKGAKS